MSHPVRSPLESQSTLSAAGRPVKSKINLDLQMLSALGPRLETSQHVVVMLPGGSITQTSPGTLVQYLLSSISDQSSI